VITHPACWGRVQDPDLSGCAARERPTGDHVPHRTGGGGSELCTRRARRYREHHRGL
jgi:hypothetical protein